MKATKGQRKGNIASPRPRPSTKSLAAGKGKLAGQPAASSAPSKGAPTHKFFNGLYAFLVIMGMIVGALGLRTRTSTTAASSARQVQPAEAAIEWVLDGGSGKGCQEVKIWADGQASSGECASVQSGQAGQFKLNAAGASQLRNWVGQFQPFSADINLASSSPANRIRLAFRGNGPKTAGVLDKQAIEKFVENLIQSGG